MKYDLTKIDNSLKQAEMSSREIAELVGKRHGNVIRDIRKIISNIDKNDLGRLKFEESEYLNLQNKKQTEYILNKMAVMLLLTKYSDKLRLRVLTRLDELEKKAMVWSLSRQESKTGYQIQSEALQETRLVYEGKQTSAFHYMNEAKLIRFAMFGNTDPIDRDLLSENELSLMTKAEECNSYLIRMGESYPTRKIKVAEFVSRQRRVKNIQINSNLS